MPRPALEGEHRYVAALMADIVGSTEITERIGAEQWFHLVQDVIQLAWATLEEFGGHPLNFTGDGILALFGAPVAVEKASLKACRAALALQARLEEQAPRYERAYGATPGVRIGIAGGEVLITGMNLGQETKPTATGSAVNLAARLQAMAPAEGIACSRQIATDVGEAARFESLGEVALKGFEGRQAVFRLAGLAQAELADARRVFVGRDAPLSKALAWLETPGAAPICLIHGEAGIGKSRFVEELAARVAGRRRLLAGSCQVETRSRPLAAIKEIFRQAAGWREGQSRADLEAGLAAIVGQPVAEIQPLVDVVGDLGDRDDVAGPDVALVLRQLVSEGMKHLASRDDSLILIEDTHWIDPLSRDILRGLVSGKTGDERLVITSRHDQLFGEERRRGILRIPLRPISREDIAAIARAGREGPALAPETVDLIVAKSEGNPFFATEILKQLAVGAATDLEKLRVGTIQNLLFARFGDLSREVRDLLRIAAVLGRNFRYGVLARAAGLDEAAARRTLAGAGDLVEADPADPLLGGRFVHVLFRDTIFASIPASRRVGLHLDVALAIKAEEAEAGGAQGGPGEAASLAYHFEAAGRPLQAIAQIEIAAGHALGLYALETCDGLMRNAFALIDHNIEHISFELYGRMLEVWTRCLELYGWHGVAHDMLSERVPHLRKGGVSASLALCLAFFAKTKAHTARFEEALALADEAIEQAAQIGEPSILAIGRIVKLKALSDSGTGTTEEMRALFDQTEAAMDFRRDPQAVLLRMFHMISAARAKGRFKLAKEITDELRALGLRQESRFLIGAAAWQELLIHFNADDLDKAEAACDLCVRNTIPGTTFNLGGRVGATRARVQRGEDVPAEVFQALLDEAEVLGEVNMVTTVHIAIALNHALQGRVRACHAVLRAQKARPRQGGAIETRRFLAVFEAEFLMSVAGLLPSGQARPKLALGDLLYALRLRLTARRRAERLLTITAAQFDDKDGGIYLARVLGDLAIIAKARGDGERARRLAERSVALFTAEGMLRRVALLEKLIGPLAVGPSAI